MKKLVFGTPEALVPTVFCKSLQETEAGFLRYPVDRIRFKITGRGCVLTLPLGESEQLYGMGLQLKLFNLRGKKVVTRVNADPVGPSGDSHAPVPFFVSTAGYGIYVDTARYAEFYFGASDFRENCESWRNRKNTLEPVTLCSPREYENPNITIFIPCAKGVTLYLFEGSTITDVVSQYNLFSGGGCDIPEWGLSPIYRCYGQYNAEQVLQIAKSFKADHIPIGIIGLEPGWQSHAYSCTYTWNRERFLHPQALIDTLNAMGYHVNLWEHAFVHPDSPIYTSIQEHSGNYRVWQGCVPDFATEEAREIFASHHKKLVAMGIDGFKLDECDSSDYTGSWSFPNCAEFPSGLDGEQYHSLFGVLYMQTVLDALGDTLTLSEVRNAGALSSPYPFVLYSDLYDHRDFLRGCATAGFSGLLWTPEVRDAATREEFIRRLQTNVFSVQCIVNAWYCPEEPWKIHGCEDEVRSLLTLRNRLKPMLKAAFQKYKACGVPPVRALVSDYTYDPHTYHIDDQFLFCDSLIVAPIPVGETGRTVYLPEGQWQDFFTKEPVPSGTFSVQTDSIPVYERIQ